MKLKLFAAASAFILVGAGCTFTQTAEVGDLPTVPPDEAMMQEDATEKDDGTMMDAEAGVGASMEAETEGEAAEESGESNVNGQTSKVAQPYYIAYTADVAADAQAEGRPVVYYFWAAWCPICKAEEPTLKAWIESSEHPIAGFRVNYDTESALKAKFKVPYQHTTIFLNANGEEVERFSGPVTEAQFRAALALAAR